MVKAIELAKANGGRLVRYPGGYWSIDGWRQNNGIKFVNGTVVHALVGRRVARYTEYGRSVRKDGKTGMPFPRVMELVEVQAEAAA